MSIGNVKPGLHNVDQYTVSGVPFTRTIAASASKTIKLTYVASEVTCVASGGTLTVTLDHDNAEAITIPAGAVVTFRGKIKKLTATADADCTGSVICILTGIKAGLLPRYDEDDYGNAS